VKKNLVLIGMMGSGKTTLGKITAKRLNLQFIDTDSNIEKKNSMTINQIFQKNGEDFFRSEEEKEVLKCLKIKNCVISIGGGAFMNKLIRESILKNCVSIWLDVDLKTIIRRVSWNKKRPLLVNEDNVSAINKLYSVRKNIYKKANYKIKYTDSSKINLVKRIIDLYEKK
jgi:shikimate kinase